MKNVFLLLFTLAFYDMAFSQEKNTNIAKTKIGDTECKYVQTIAMQKQDTSYYVWLIFKDLRYRELNETGILGFNNNERYKKFISDLKSAIPEINQKTSDVTWDEKDYRLLKMEDRIDLILSEVNGAYTKMSYKETVNLVTWLERIQIGNPVLQTEIKR